MPVLFAGGKPYDVAGADRLNRAAFALCPATASRHDQRLAERVGWGLVKSSPHISYAKVNCSQFLIKVRIDISLAIRTFHFCVPNVIKKSM